MNRKSNIPAWCQGDTARVQRTKQIACRGTDDYCFQRCGRVCALLVFLCLFSGAARVHAQTTALRTATLLIGPATGTDRLVLAVTLSTYARNASIYLH